MVTSLSKSRKGCRCLPSRFNEINGRHEETRTPDLYRVNFLFNNLKPFACFAFPNLRPPKKHPKIDGFGDELVTSCRVYFEGRICIALSGDSAEEISSENPRDEINNGQRPVSEHRTRPNQSTCIRGDNG